MRKAHRQLNRSNLDRLVGASPLRSRSRRQFLGYSATGAASALFGCSGDPKAADSETVGTGMPTTGGTESNGTTTPDTPSTMGPGGTPSSTMPAPMGGTGMMSGGTGGSAGAGPVDINPPPAGEGGMGGSGGAEPSTPSGGSSTEGGGDAGGSSGSGGTASGGTEAGGQGAGGSTGVTIDGWKEDNAADCMMTGTPPTFDQAVENEKLPDPFKFIDGSRISRKEDWHCLRKELSAIVQACIYGPKMPPPDTLDSTYSNGTLTINMTVGGQSGSFNVTINGGGSESDPVPCLISCGGSSLGMLQGVASITMPNGTIAQESRNVASGGLVHMLYGNAASQSGSCIGWAWGLSRILDALEQHPEAGIDVKRIAVTGCSRNGKGALAMGAFDERVALTIPQEGGSGGPACWKVAAREYAMGQNIQEAGEIVGEANWMGAPFGDYANPRQNNFLLPGDQNLTIALCAPRAVLIIDNDIDWLGPVACYAGGAAARPVFEALGIADRIGVSVAAEHPHCQFPQSQQAALQAFVQRFLFGMNTDTSGVDELNTQSRTSKLGTFEPSDWIDWDTPTLSGSLVWDPFA